MKNWSTYAAYAGHMEDYFLPCSGNNSDRTREIEEKLNTYGVCLLGSGIYCVRGVRMPEHSTLMGMGDATTLLLPPDVASGCAVRMNSFCTVKDLGVKGAEEWITLPETVGTRHGILFEGTATTKDWQNQTRNAILSGCQIASFTGGGLTCVDTGYHICSALTATNCHILNCGAGIHIPHFSEYHEFTNILCSGNRYGCINNGGNNVFVNCGFNSNTLGFWIDNSHGQSNNNSHGSVVGCTFNHTDENRGIGILLQGAQHGHVFSGCQVFYSKIVLENSSGILFQGFNFGKNAEIDIKGGSLTMFSDCVFNNPPTVTVEENDAVRFSACYTRDGSAVDIDA